MPISKANKARYPKDWEAIRERILTRANHCCEFCGVPNHAVGYRDENGAFVACYGNGPVDAIGRGRAWPNESIRATYAEAREHADDFNFNDCRRWIVIVLTIAHIFDHSPENCEPSNLAALCQRCHNRHDAPSRQQRRRERLQKIQPQLFSTL